MTAPPAGSSGPFEIAFSYEAEAHLLGLSARQRATILDAIERRLGWQANVESRNRKRLRPNPIAPWELRAGSLRVYFDVEVLPRKVVKVLAVGVEERNRLWIGGEEVELA